MTCHRKSKAIETIMMSTATMTVIGGRFIIQVCPRKQSDVTAEFCHSQTDPVPNFSLGGLVRIASSATDKVRVGHQSQDREDWDQHCPGPSFPRRRGDRMSAPAASWCDPAGESPVQVRSSVRLVASVAWSLATAAAKRTQRLHGVWD